MPPRALPPLLLLASLSRASFLAGVEWRDFDRAGIVTAVGFVNLTLNAALDHELTLGSNFTVVSSLFSCNVAQRLDAAGRLAAYVVPEGEGDELTKLPYTVDLFAADRSGAHLSSAPEAAQRWDVSSIADVPGLGLSFGLATRPPMDIGLPVFVVALNSSSGAVENVTDALPGIIDIEECASAVGSSRGSGGGTLLFLNNVVHAAHRMQQVVLFDVALRQVTNVLLYPDGILSAIVGWRNASSGEDLALAFAWSALGGGPALVAFDPAAKAWAPRVLWAFDASVLPMPHCLAVDVEADAAYGLLQGSDCPPRCFTDIQVGTFSNLSSPSAFAASTAFVAPALEQFFPVGIAQCAVVQSI